MVRGPAVLDMQQAFAENWQEVTGALLPAAGGGEKSAAGSSLAVFVKSKENSIATADDRLTQLLIASARQRIWISNAYFLPSAPIMALLARKARQGVDVRVLAAGERTDMGPYLSPQRTRMDDLVREGVRGFEYQPTMMHGKTMVLDDAVVMVGSTNLDALSLNHMDEGALLVADPALAKEEARRFLQDLSHSVERTAH
jgi:cardiolipin synthase